MVSYTDNIVSLTNQINSKLNDLDINKNKIIFNYQAFDNHNFHNNHYITFDFDNFKAKLNVASGKKLNRRIILLSIFLGFEIEKIDWKWFFLNKGTKND